VGIVIWSGWQKIRENERKKNQRSFVLSKRKRKKENEYKLVAILGLFVEAGLGIGGKIWVVHHLSKVRQKPAVRFERVFVQPRLELREFFL